MPKNLIAVLIGFIILFFNGIGQASECQSERVKVQMLGTRGPEFLDEHASTGYLIWLDDHARIIVDAGPGTVQRFKQSGANYEDILLMLFTHFHVDHSSDFPAYIKGGYFTEKSKNLDIIGPSGTDFVSSTDQFVMRMLGKNGVFHYLGIYLDPDAESSYKIHVKTVPWSSEDLTPKTVYDHGGVVVKSVPVHHGSFPAIGYRIEIAGCVISFTGDMSGQLGAMPKLAIDSDLLIAHNAVPEDETGIAAFLHMKPSYIGAMAAQAKVKKLLLTHLMNRTIHRKEETILLIRKAYKGPIEFPTDLDVFHP
jgi:ribonuclease BN (tRNA processing enzyme)